MNLVFHKFLGVSISQNICRQEFLHENSHMQKCVKRRKSTTSVSEIKLKFTIRVCQRFGALLLPLNRFHITFFFLFNGYLAGPRPNLGHYWGDSLTNPILIPAFDLFRSESHRETRSEVGPQSPAEHLVGSERRSFRSWM